MVALHHQRRGFFYLDGIFAAPGDVQRQIQLLRKRVAVAFQHALGGEGRFKPQRKRNMLVDAQRVQQPSRHTHAAQQVGRFTDERIIVAVAVAAVGQIAHCLGNGGQMRACGLALPLGIGAAQGALLGGAFTVQRQGGPGFQPGTIRHARGAVAMQKILA